MRRLFCMLLLLALLWPVNMLADRALTDRAPTIFVATDPHFISPSLTDYGPYFMRMIESGDGKLVHYSDELTDAFVQQVISRQPDCLILSGDLTFNGAKKSHEDLAQKLRAIDQSGIPVQVLPGNHDVYCYAAASFSGDSYTLTERTTSEDFVSIYRDLGFDEAVSRDPYSLSYIAEPVPGIWILMLDVNTQFMPGAVAQNTFSWLDKVLAKAQETGKKLIAVSHQNLYAHSSLLYQGFVIANAAMLESRYEKYGVAVNLSGHLHMQHTLSVEGKTPEIATSSLAVSPCQYGVITLEDGLAQYRTETVDVSAWAVQNGKTNPNLLDFAQYAAGFFAATSTRQSAMQAGNDPDRIAMDDWLAQLNAAYFSGRLDTVDPTSEYAQRWQQGDAFFSSYVRSILSEELRDHTRLTFPY